MKGKKTDPEIEIKTEDRQKQVLSREVQRNPELIEKFYKQIINSFGYAYPAKI